MIKQIQGSYSAPKLEKEIQEFWKSEHAYEKTKEMRKDGENFYFVDGPPYTTGSIHLGTAMNKTVKDILIRYWRMNGYNVRDQPGFDMHGLPIEVQVEKKIGVHSKKQIIEEIGIDKFVETCQEFALGLHGTMTEAFKQLGVWMDWEKPYQTLKLDYMESGWWAVQQAYNKGLLKDSSRVVTWFPRCETALVHPAETYAKVKMSGDAGSETVIIMKSQAEYVMKAGGYTSFEILSEMNGKELIGIHYLPPFEIGDALQTGQSFLKGIGGKQGLSLRIGDMFPALLSEGRGIPEIGDLFQSGQGLRVVAPLQGFRTLGVQELMLSRCQMGRSVLILTHLGESVRCLLIIALLQRFPSLSVLCQLFRVGERSQLTELFGCGGILALVQQVHAFGILHDPLLMG